MTVQASIVADSMAPSNVRLTTMLLTYATIIHQDILTHRSVYKMRAGDHDEYLEVDSSKSTNSNRAKPTKTVLQEVWRNPFCPTRFPKRAITMHSSKGYLSGWRHQIARHLWLKLRYIALLGALLLMWIGTHKQIANRLLMPWTYTTLVMTAVDQYWYHFFMLRNHEAAQDEVQEVAKLAQQVYSVNTPNRLDEGDWHLPFITETERYKMTEHTAICVSVARCARTSYATSHEDMWLSATKRPVSEDMALFNRLAVQIPMHDGPREHQASAHSNPAFRSGNLFGWEQLRHSEMGRMLYAMAASAPTPSVR